MATHQTSALVPNGVGLHARPAALFVQQASGFSSTIQLTCGERTADGKSILGVLQLGASAAASASSPSARISTALPAEALAAFIRAIA